MVRLAASLICLLALAGCGSDEPAQPASLTGAWTVEAATIAFADGRLTGTTGCNRLSATYSVDGDTLELGDVVTTRMACPDVDERPFLDKLGRVARFERDGDTLVLQDAGGGELLRLQRTRASTKPS